MMIFERKVFSQLKQWKENSKGRSAILLDGARRVGKTTIAKEFAKSNYRSYILIDFVTAPDSLKNIFVKNRNDLDMFFNLLQLHTGTTLYERDSLLIFDEVQQFPLAREMIKELVSDGRYDYLETGSLISLKSNVRNIRIPSEEHTICVHPMDFEEWLLAIGQEVTANILRKHCETLEPLGEDTHEVIMRKYREYMVIGGMPQVVSAYADTKSIMEVESVKQDILTLYRNDMMKIPDTPTLTLSYLNSIPGILSSHSRITRASKVSPGTRKEKLIPPAEWLSQARIINRCRCCTDPSLVPALSEDVGRYKSYLLDTGLLISLSFELEPERLRDTYFRLIEGDLSINEGMFFENMVAQELVAKGYPLWFVEMSRKDSARKYEVDFIVPMVDYIVPVEAKSGMSSKHRSLDVLMERYPDRVRKAYVIHTKDLRTKGDIVYLPIYMLQFLNI